MLGVVQGITLVVTRALLGENIGQVIKYLKLSIVLH